MLNLNLLKINKKFKKIANPFKYFPFLISFYMKNFTEYSIEKHFLNT